MANSTIQIADLDFDQIKQNFINYLQGLPGNPFQDYDFKGSALNTLLDILAYNTHYQAFHLNMIANEMFLDTATQRKSVVSHAKLLNYTPISAVAPTAEITVTIGGVDDPTLTLPKYTRFLSEPIDGVNYPFVTLDDQTVVVSNGTATFSNVSIKEGEKLSYSYNVDLVANPSAIFDIPDANVDTSTLMVVVYDSPSSTSYTIYNKASDYLLLDSNTKVYFLQEGLNGNYQIYFGDGVLGSALTTGQVVNMNYLTTHGNAAAGANSFVMIDRILEYSNVVVTPITSASQGSDKESIDSIKFKAPKAYSAQNRAVTKDDYIVAVMNNQLGYSFDAVNVWGGQENNPPVYGKVFISLKPAGGLTLTPTQKNFIIEKVLKPISVITAQPEIVDPDYTFVQINTNVLYQPKNTTLTTNQIQSAVTNSINYFSSNTLNNFDSVFSLSDLILYIKNSDSSIITSESSIKLQKKFYPLLGGSSDYVLNYNAPLERGLLNSGISSSPALAYADPNNPSSTLNNVFLEEIPSSSGSIEKINILNTGYGYTLTPSVEIVGDGTGATATAVLVNGSISSIIITNSGINYTEASVIITNDPNDLAGRGAAALAVVQNSLGKIRAIYYNQNNVKTTLFDNVGTIDYVNGIITLTNFNPVSINNATGELTINVNPKSTIIESKYNQILTIDQYDNNSIIVNVTAKTT